MTDAALLGYVAQRTGMRVAGAQQRRLTRLLDRAHQESGLTAGAFTELLRGEPTAFDALVDELTVGETYFFRERPQLELARDAVMEQAPRGRTCLRVWSAGCSTGEEAYTLSMLLGAGEGVQVLGTDISRAALARAGRAAYGERSLRAVTDAERSRFFEPVRRRAVRVREAVRGTVRFQPANLLDAPPAAVAFDLVLCRNVLIYLSPEAVAQVAANLRDALAPSGWLLTGVADPLLEAAGLERVSTRQGALYRRSAARAPARHRREPVAPTVATHPEQTPTPLPLPLPPARTAPLDAVALLEPRDAATAEPAAVVEAAATDGDAAVAGAQAAVDAAPLDPLLRYRLALRHLEQGDLRLAATAASAAVFLEPTFIVAHLLLGRVFEGLREERKARRCFRTAAALLEQLPGDAPVPNAEGETAEALARVVGTALSTAPLGDGGGR